MAKQRIGLQTFFAPNQVGFTEQLAAMATEQRGRKEAALGEIRKTLSEKQVYSAYAANANKLLEDQVKQIAGSLDVDPTAYTDAVNDYLKYYNYSEQFKSFINDAAASYKADKEVNYNDALKAIQDKYVKKGSLDELEQNIINGVDAEKVLLETPGALKSDEIIKSRLEKFGSVDRLVEEASKKLTKEEGGYPFLVQSMDSIRQKINNAVEFDDKGNIRIKDIAQLESLGIIDTMLSDDRVNAVVKQRLTSQEKEVNEDNKRQALREMMTPFATGEIAKKAEAKMIEDPERIAALKKVYSVAKKTGEQGKPLELLSTKLDNMYNGVETIARGGTSQDWKTYSRAGAVSPAGNPYTHFSTLFNGRIAERDEKQYAVNGLFMDSNYNVYMRGREVLEGEAVEDTTKLTPKQQAERAKAEAKGGAAAKPESKVKYGPEQIIPFDAQDFQNGVTSSLRDEYNKFAATRRQQFREFKRGIGTTGTAQAPRTLNDLRQQRQQQQQQQQQQEAPFNFNYNR